jgi:hypothetical protein
MLDQRPYLVQRGKIRRPLVDGRFSDAVNLDYMGSAEFEWGALPKSLRALQAQVDAIKITVDPRITENEKSVRVLHTFDEATFEEYFTYLLKMRADTHNMKELSHFEEGRTKYHLETDFWWDVDNHVMWSFDKVFMNRLGDVLVNSWKYMDEQKKLKG